MKRAFLVFLCAAAVSTVEAQVQFGVKGGLNITSMVGNDVDVDGVKMKLGLHVGGLARLPITEQIKLQPELVFSTQGAQSQNGEKVNLNLNYLNVPVLAQYHTSVGFYGETGPQLGFLISAKSKYDGNSIDIKDGYKSLDFAWAFGAGYHFVPELGVNVRYNLGISRLDDDGDAKIHNSVFQLGVFYLFGAKK
jgi:Outer membrane protein beta-barrel domain